MTHDESLRVDLEVVIHAERPHVFGVMIGRLTEWFVIPPTGEALAMKLEAWPGGRLYRDLPGNTGNLWGFVQVIRPPELLEITGPAFFSGPGLSHISFRLEEIGAQGRAATRLLFCHRAIGPLGPMGEIAKGKWGWVLSESLKPMAEA